MNDQVKKPQPNAKLIEEMRKLVKGRTANTAYRNVTKWLETTPKPQKQSSDQAEAAQN